MSDPEYLDAMSNLLDSIASVVATMDDVKSADAKRILSEVAKAAASHIPAVTGASVSQLRAVPEPKERPL